MSAPINFDTRCAVAEDAATYYVQVEIKIPKVCPANLTTENLSAATRRFMESLRL